VIGRRSGRTTKTRSRSSTARAPRCWISPLPWWSTRSSGAPRVAWPAREPCAPWKAAGL